MSTLRTCASFSCGVVFALGLGLAGMTRPEKIQGYLDFFGAWDPTLLFVMASGVTTFAIAHAVARRRPRPACDLRYFWPSRLSMDAKTAIGAGIFGVGWALAGFCPGPAITSLITGQGTVIAFVFGMLGGILLFQRGFARVPRASVQASVPAPQPISVDAP